MVSQTKMIIITSDEDIIRQFVDLNNKKQVTSTAHHNHDIIDLNLLAELSQLNSSNDHIYKRALDSSDHKQTKVVKTTKKSNNLICKICGDYAIGFNYDALSCASCKAFFRRNAKQNPEKIKCLTGQGQCSITHDIQRKCTKCRLDRCFSMGMRKDFIQSEQKLQQRKMQREENRNMTLKSTISNSKSLSSTTFDEIDQLLMDIDKADDLNQFVDTLSNTLSIDDWMIIENMRSLFLSTFQHGITKCCSTDLSDRTSALISWSHVVAEKAMCFINFSRQIDEFERLHNDDRFILIKYNLLPLTPIHRCYFYDLINNSFPCAEKREQNKHRQFFMLCFESDDVRETFINSIISFAKITEQDPILLSLLLIVLLFSQGLAMSEDEPSLQDPLGVYRAQSYYTRMLWNYMVYKQGEIEACKQFTRLLTELFRMQSMIQKFLEFLRVQFTSSVAVDRIAPLMQTFLNIS